MRYLTMKFGVMLAAAAVLVWTGAARAADDEAGFRQLFDGQTLNGWEGDPKLWSVQDGAITGKTTPEDPLRKNSFLIWRQGEVDDFELRASFRIEKGNSGIQYRSVDMGDFVVGGYQADFAGAVPDKFSGLLYEEKMRGILAERGQKVVRGADGTSKVEPLPEATELAKYIKAEEWNEYTIVARGNHITQTINGHLMSELTDGEVAKRRMSGILALQIHVGPPMVVQFKNIRLKRLPLEGRKKIVLVAGKPSHMAGDHEHNAGVLLLRKCLEQTPNVQPASYINGWPADPSAFDNADAVMLYMDGGAHHPAISPEHLASLGALMDKGVGLACIHYAVEVPKDKGGPEWLRWIGGYYETGYSINPHWDADFKALPTHPITQGVAPFAINDEWYFNIRFRDSGVTPILQAIPPDDKRKTPAAAEHKGRNETVAWATERPDGGRGFGFTGAHKHVNWGDANFRKLVLNALLWTAKADVPADGAASTITPEDLKANLDKK